MDVKFPIPNITERFVDNVVFACGGRRLTDEEKNFEKLKNAGYLFEGCIAELKIIEEEGLLKEEKQGNIANIFKRLFPTVEFINIENALGNEQVKQEYFSIIEKPIRKVIRKASKQLKSTHSFLGWDQAEKIIIIVNNGFASIQADDFKKICIKSAKNDTSSIDNIVTISLRVVGNGFDTMTFIDTGAISINKQTHSTIPENIRHEVVNKYAQAMTYMMRNQVEASQSKDKASYIKDILFEKHGISFVYPAPILPNSMFEK